MFLFSNGSVIEFESGDVIKIKFLKLRDLSEYSDRTTSKWSTKTRISRQIVSEILALFCSDESTNVPLNLLRFMRGEAG